VSGDSAAPEDVVLSKIQSCDGCKRIPNSDTPHSYAFTINGHLFFVPHAVDQSFYTVAQLSVVEAALAYFGIDLLPLDQNLVRQQPNR
jgi:hypothetical protein